MNDRTIKSLQEIVVPGLTNPAMTALVAMVRRVGSQCRTLTLHGHERSAPFESDVFLLPAA